MNCTSIGLPDTVIWPPAAKTVLRLKKVMIG